jgi:hypothetical protein
MRTLVATLMLFLVPLPGSSQTAQPQAYVPSRTADGQPDLQGVWQVLNTAAWDLLDHNGRLGVPAGQGVVDGNEIPYQPWAAARKLQNYRQRATADPETRCEAPGVPRVTYMPFPLQIVQTKNATFILYEYGFHRRVIYTDGSRHPEDVPLLMGDSRGRWEGNSLVVDSANFTDKTWLDRAGNFHSAALHVIERYTRTSAEHISYEVTIEDPEVFTRPWKMRMLLYRRAEPQVQLLEYSCYEHLMYEKGISAVTPD